MVCRHQRILIIQTFNQDRPITMEADPLKLRLQQEALSLGFDVIKVTEATLPADTQHRFHAFLAEDRHGDMDWLANRADERTDPQTLWPRANTVIMLGMNYGPDTDPLTALEKKSSGTISVYAQHKDYHDVVKKRLKRLARWLVSQSETEVKVFVDTAPVMEKPLAAQSGLGWQGKHTNLVSREFGSWLFLGSIFTSLLIPPDPPEDDHCGTCQNCLDICPTKAFPAPYQLDARRCISYLTIENKGPIPIELRKAMGNRIYGCDDCLAVCPWNKFASLSQESAFHARDTLQSPALGELAALDDTAFRSLFSGSPVKRTGRNRFMRNVLIAIGNSADRTLIPHAENLLADDNNLVRGAAVWALSQLCSSDEIGQLAANYAADEVDDSVKTEWQLALGH